MLPRSISWSPCVQLFRRDGQLTEEMLDDAGVPKPMFPRTSPTPHSRNDRCGQMKRSRRMHSSRCSPSGLSSSVKQMRWPIGRPLGFCAWLLDEEASSWQGESGGFFFGKAYLSIIKQPLTAHDPIHPQVPSRPRENRENLSKRFLCPRRLNENKCRGISKPRPQVRQGLFTRARAAEETTDVDR